MSGLVGLLTFAPLFASDDIDCCENTTVITSPKYCGEFYGSFSWLYLLSMPTDGDLQTGTFLTLTVPPNLFACLQQLQSKPSHAFRTNLGYNIPCTSCNVDLTYFHYKGSDTGQIKNIQLNQFTQSFLGGAYSSLDSCEEQKINRANAVFAKRYFIDDCLLVQPYLGIGYGNVVRDLCVTFTGLIDSPPSVTDSTLNGVLQSKYWGLGPVFGSNFSYPIFKCISFQGTFGGGVLLGNINSCIDAVEMNVQNDMAITSTFAAADCNFRAVPFINSQLAFAFHPALKNNCLDCELKVGYEIDYYFNAVDRINPFNGFVINQNSFPVKKTSHLGLGGPFIKLLLRGSDTSYYTYCGCDYNHNNCCSLGFYGEFTSSWLKSVSNNDDLVFATIGTENECEIKHQTCFNFSWNGTGKLGYKTEHDLDFHITYFRFTDQSSACVMAEDGARITSVNASGDDMVTYSQAQSQVEYNLNQVEFLAGKYFYPFCRLELLLSSGLRFASLDRSIQNQYTGGIPPFGFESKFNCLQSKFRGAGPVFVMEPEVCFCGNLALTGYFSTSLLMGRLKSTLDQVNEGTVAGSSNTLRTPKTRWVVPVVDASAGLSYNFCLFSKLNVKLEAGYQFSEYFKAINLVFPNFLTGLEQNNSDLKLHGPYLTLTVGF